MHAGPRVHGPQDTALDTCSPHLPKPAGPRATVLPGLLCCGDPGSRAGGRRGAWESGAPGVRRGEVGGSPPTARPAVIRAP